VKKLWKLATKAHMIKLVTALWLVMKDKRTPLVAKLIGGAVLAYALSPIDLIPDFIPVLGMLDDLIIIPFGIALAAKFVPAAQWQQALTDAEQFKGKLPKVMAGLLLVLAVWLGLLLLSGWWLLSLRPLV
jgi:uncharacterized membrane protein YkvA (DUF1232 family)